MLYTLLYSEKTGGFADAYLGLDGKFKDAVGQQVLVVENRINSSGRGGLDETVTTILELGILTSPPEKNDLGEITLSTDKYAYRRRGHNPTEWQLIEGQIKIQLYRIGRIGQEIEQVMSGRDCHKGGLSIYTPALSFKIGKDVESYFRGGEELRINESKVKRATNGKIDGSYLDALELLGLEIPTHLETFEHYLKEEIEK